MAEQKTGTQDVLGSVANLVQATETIRRNAREQRSFSKGIQDRMAGLHLAFQEISQAMDHQERQARQLELTVESLQDLARSSRAASDNLASILR
jgi:methyl-accepting chemotaxis protein